MKMFKCKLKNDQQVLGVLKKNSKGMSAYDVLKELQKNIHCSILFVSHHLGVIAELCDDDIVMYAGEIVESGSVRDIFHRPKHPYTQALFACDPGRIMEKSKACVSSFEKGVCKRTLDKCQILGTRDRV